MPSFNENEIDEAKRRVIEMQNRASRFVVDKQEAPAKPKENPHNNVTQKDKAVEDTEEKSDDKSFYIILALIMLLSKEGADNTLILALLYLLL